MVTTTKNMTFNWAHKVFVNYDNEGDQIYTMLSGRQLWAGIDVKVTNSNPNWRQVIASGGDATGKYIRRSCKYTPAKWSGNVFIKPRAIGLPNSSIKSNGFGVYPGGNPLVSFLYTGDDAALNDQALVKIKRKLRSHTQQASSLVPLVELRELRGTIRGAAELTTSMLKTMLSIKQTGGKSVHRWASKAWLNFSFGVSPLISEANAISESIAEYLARRDHSVRLTGTATKTWKTRYVDNPSYITLAGCNGSVVSDVVHELSYKYVGAFDLALRSANNYGVSEHFGLEFGQLPLVFWELTPYSWVVDYFTNVGEFMEDRFTTLPGSLRYLSRSRRYRCFWQTQVTSTILKGSTGKQNFSCIPGVGEYYDFSRTIHNVLPHVGLHFKTVDRIGKNGINKVLNLAALLLK